MTHLEVVGLLRVTMSPSSSPLGNQDRGTAMIDLMRGTSVK